MGDASYESFYQGGPSSMSSDYSNGTFIGYRMGAGQIASTTGIGTANQLNEVVSRIKEGVKNVELQPLAGDVFDQIPVQHWKEMQALMKLSGVKASVHAPIVNPAGFGEGGWVGEQARLDAERRFKGVIERAHTLDPNGNTPVVFHSTEGVQGATYVPGEEKDGLKQFKKIEEMAVNVETGQMMPLKEKRKFSPYDLKSLQGDPLKNKDSGTLFGVEDQLESANRTTWESSLEKVAVAQKQTDEVLGTTFNDIDSFKGAQSLEQKDILAFNTATHKLNNAEIFLDNVELDTKSAFEKLYEYGTDKQRDELKKLAEKVNLKGLGQKEAGLKYAKSQNEIDEQTFALERAKVFKAKVDACSVMIERINELSDPQQEYGGAPKLFKPLEEFAMEKTAKTFGNVAWHGYDKFGDNAPIVAMENMYAGMPFSRAEDMQKLVKETKKVFVENAVKKGMDEDTAKEKADKLIGVTWDVGHLNIMKKKGFTDSEVVAETKKIQNVVKHVHLTDNFGYGDSHLAPGMGNVPIKKILEQLEKNGEFGKMRKVVEAGALVAQGSGLGMSPTAWSLKAFGSPIYGMQNSSYWNQASGMMGGYFSGYGDSNPSGHHSIYGSGFTTLPRDFGGNVPGTNSRFSGTPNA